MQKLEAPKATTFVVKGNLDPDVTSALEAKGWRNIQNVGWQLFSNDAPVWSTYAQNQAALASDIAQIEDRLFT